MCALMNRFPCWRNQKGNSCLAEAVTPGNNFGEIFSNIYSYFDLSHKLHPERQHILTSFFSNFDSTQINNSLVEKGLLC
jgi:hypothetical protein